jgi:hypothetical protein
MSFVFRVYDSTVSARELQSKNGLFKAVAIIGASRDDRVRNCFEAEERYTLMSQIYFEGKESLALCNRGIKYICAIMKADDLAVRKRKCMSYLFTSKGRWLYTDILITSFAKTLLSEVNNDSSVKKLYQEELSNECGSFSIDPGQPSLEDCVQHLFGFQYEMLKSNVEHREFPNSRKTKALKKCLDEMDGILEKAKYPEKCIS